MQKCSSAQPPSLHSNLPRDFYLRNRPLNLKGLPPWYPSSKLLPYQLSYGIVVLMFSCNKHCTIHTQLQYLYKRRHRSFHRALLAIRWSRFSTHSCGLKPFERTPTRSLGKHFDTYPVLNTSTSISSVGNLRAAIAKLGYHS